MKSRWIQPDGTEVEHDLPDDPSLTTMQEFVGGDIELVTVLYKDKRCHMIVHGEGAIIGLLVNPIATNVYHEAVVKPRCKERKIPYIPNAYAMIHGPAILFEGTLS